MVAGTNPDCCFLPPNSSSTSVFLFPNIYNNFLGIYFSWLNYRQRCLRQTLCRSERYSASYSPSHYFRSSEIVTGPSFFYRRHYLLNAHAYYLYLGSSRCNLADSRSVSTRDVTDNSDRLYHDFGNILYISDLFCHSKKILFTIIEKLSHICRESSFLYWECGEHTVTPTSRYFLSSTHGAISIPADYHRCKCRD